MATWWRSGLAAAVLVALVACGAGTGTGTGSGTGDASGPVPGAVASSSAAPSGEQRFPTILEVSLSAGSSEELWDVAVTISSPYDSPDRYADAFRVAAQGGRVLGVRVLTHDHASEQPFTRSLLGVEIPPGLSHVVVTARDSGNGWAETGVGVPVPER